MQWINRPQELAFLQRHRDHHIIKVVSGVRRCGKSTLFHLFRDRLLADGVPASRILTINLEDLAFESLQEYHALYRYVLEHLAPGGRNYIFLDEIQQVPSFEKAVDSLFLRDDVDLYLTGSNAYFLSGDLATVLAGRYVELRMLPLSFCEFCEGLPAQPPLTEAQRYAAYVQGSSFPYLLTVPHDAQGVREYLEGLYHTILIKDTMTRLGTADTSLLEKILRYLAANIGSLISPTKSANALTSQGRRTDNKTVERYLRAMEDSLLIYRADRYDVRGKSIFKTNAKYYLVDPAFRALLVADTSRDTGHVLENIVYLELLHRGARVYVGQLAKGEIDFIAETSEGRFYYQVAETTLAPDVLDRELAPLRAVPDQYPKTLLTLDEITPEADYDGIRKRNVLRWMREGK